MVTIVSRKNAAKSLVQSRGMTVLAWTAATAVVLALGACASKGETEKAEAPASTAPAAPAEESGGLVFGGINPGGPATNSRFASPANVAKGSPDLNTVPTEAPKPRSTAEERDKAMSGLVADRVNARYTDQAGRTQPVAVRPYVDTPEAARADAVGRIDAPAPARPAEGSPEVAATEIPIPTPEARNSDVGPRSPNAVPRRGTDVASNGALQSPSAGGFRALADFEAASYGRATLAGTLALSGGNLTPNDRNVLNTTARQQIDTRSKGALRVVGHGAGGMERAMVAANELQRLGVAPSNLFVGVDNITGPTEVFFVRGK